ncbi:hypothetical protein C8Q73DRAFT_125293 [Cubamyces lactineus]|nr:hypothetical protein C8Q73DRAFT_125293 [Cubamyces lactineus]
MEAAVRACASNGTCRYTRLFLHPKSTRGTTCEQRAERRTGRARTMRDALQLLYVLEIDMDSSHESSVLALRDGKPKQSRAVVIPTRNTRSHILPVLERNLVMNPSRESRGACSTQVVTSQRLNSKRPRDVQSLLFRMGNPNKPELFCATSDVRIHVLIITPGQRPHPPFLFAILPANATGCRRAVKHPGWDDIKFRLGLGSECTETESVTCGTRSGRRVESLTVLHSRFTSANRTSVFQD